MSNLSIIPASSMANPTPFVMKHDGGHFLTSSAAKEGVPYSSDWMTDLEKRLRKFRSESLVFRSRAQRDINSVGSMITVAIKVLTFLSGLFRKSSSPSSFDKPNDGVTSSSGSSSNSANSNVVDRIDAGSESLDIAMGTLMAFGGKYLRQTAVWLFDQIEESNALDKIDGSSTATTSSVSGGNSIGGYLENLSPTELEELATKAVAAGANPLKLQEAFVKAQNSGDWSDLEVEISSALGPESVGGSSIGGSSALSGISNFISGFIGGTSNSSSSSSSTSQVPPSGGPMYYVYMVQDTIQRMDKVISSEPDPEDPQTANMILRFIKEFQLEKEAFAFQTQVNKLIKQVNTVLGEDQDNAVPNNIPAPSHSGGSGTSVSQAYNLFGFNIPDPFKYIFEGEDGSNEIANKKVGVASDGSTSSSSSTVSGELNPLFLASFGVLAALGTVAVGSYISNNSLDSKRKNSLPNSISKLDYTTSNLQFIPSDHTSTLYQNGLYAHDAYDLSNYNNYY